jgi:hypothetical protein
MGSIEVVGTVLEVDGVSFVETIVASEQRNSVRAAAYIEKAFDRASERQEFTARMDNWRKVVHGSVKAGGSSQYCAGWAKLYVHLRTSEAAPAQDVLAEKIRPLNPTVSTNELDAWLIEAAWRTLGDYNERQALKCLYIQQWPASQIRRFLRGVRSHHVPLVIAKAEKNLQRVLKCLGDAATSRSTTCLPGCPVPFVETDASFKEA